MLGDARKELNSQLYGNEPFTFEGAHPTPIPLVTKGGSTVGDFFTSKIDCSKGAFSALRIKLSTYGQAQSGRLFANIFNPNGKLLASSSVDAANIIDNAIFTFDYGLELCGSGNSEVTLGLGVKQENPSTLATWYTQNNELILSRIYSKKISNGIK
jgi:hypothetical protein